MKKIIEKTLSKLKSVEKSIYDSNEKIKDLRKQKKVLEMDLEDIKNRITAVNEEVSNLKSSLLELLPAWDDIFGDTKHKSISTIKKGIKEGTDIISNSKIVTDKGKPSYFISSFIDEKGTEQSVTGTIAQLDRLKKAIDSLNDKKNAKPIYRDD